MRTRGFVVVKQSSLSCTCYTALRVALLNHWRHQMHSGCLSWPAVSPQLLLNHRLCSCGCDMDDWGHLLPRRTLTKSLQLLFTCLYNMCFHLCFSQQICLCAVCIDCEELCFPTVCSVCSLIRYRPVSLKAEWSVVWVVVVVVVILSPLHFKSPVFFWDVLDLDKVFVNVLDY